MRVYLPATVPMLRDWLAAGAATVTGAAFGVTPALREWYREGDAEELEHAASLLAAAAALELVTQDSSAPARRVVLAADVDAADCTFDADARGVLRLAGPIPVARWASALVDDAAAEEVVRAAAGVLRDAHATDDDVAFALGEAEAAELGWYAVQELSFL